jgi:hypothetical protein
MLSRAPNGPPNATGDKKYHFSLRAVRKSVFQCKYCLRVRSDGSERPFVIGYESSYGYQERAL